MAQLYNYQESFWDEDDQGVTVLLQHVGRGICTCELLLDCFTKRSELEMDYARRLGALSSKMVSNMERYSDYNNMCESLKYFQNTQQTVANGHSKAYERLNRENVGTMNDFLKQYRARWSTIKGHVERLRRLKDEKKKALKSLDQELLSAQSKLSDCKLNLETALGEYQKKEGTKELEKWSLIVEESLHRKAVLSHEYKAARAHWFEEWRSVSGDLQDLEIQRIQLSRELLQQYAECTSQTSELELSLMEQLKQRLSSFTPELEISHFSYHHGTGRIKLKKSNSVSTQNSTSMSSDGTRQTPVTSHTGNYLRKPLDVTKNDRYVQNVKRLSTQLRNSRLSSVSTTVIDKELPQPELKKTEKKELVGLPAVEIDRVTEQKYIETYNEHETAKSCPEHRATSSESSEETSSNPTDFTHKKNKASHDSMSTSLSSMASSVDDSQRYVKSWNSQNRRKSRPSSIYSPTIEPKEKFANEKATAPSSSFNGRRKSIALDVETTLEILEQEGSRPITSRASSGASSNLTVNKSVIPFNSSMNVKRCRRVTVNGQQQNLPIVDSMGNPVLKYAKALYAFTEPNDNNILNFNTGDIILLVECVNDDWYVGEVYQGTTQHGLVPMNYVEITS